uniref:Ig-like domain-containing protein n=1 Tax=Cyprinus carpio TaxID=7962 RepID=A0A8C1PZL2_CYPCA
MDLLMFMFVTVIPVISDGLIVKGPSGPLVAPLGSSVVLPCSVDELLSAEGLKVEWRRTGSETLVHLYQDGKSRTESQQQDYQERANFFTDQIQHGNFSLRLDNLRAEDEGQYRCTVYIQQESGETVVQIKVINVEHFIVSSSDHSTLASVGEDVTLSCSVDSHIPPEHIEEVSWKKVNEDEEEGILVLLYQDNKTLPDSSDERYKDRVELFTAEIPKGNFSLRLKSVRTEDKGVYMCQVFAGGLSANATAVLEQLGFSALHIMVLILCISASGSALVLCCLIFCRSHNNAPAATKHIRTLGFLHALLPNIILFVAFFIWGFIEGFLYETVSCCTLNILRPLMLIYAAPYLEKMSGYALFTEIFIFIVVYCSVLLSHAWERAVHHLESDKVMALVLFGVAILFFVIGFIYLLTKKKEIQYCGEICKWIWNKLAFVSGFFFLLLPSFQFAIVFFAFRDTIGGSYVSLAAHCAQVFYFLSFSCLFKLKEQNSCLELLNKIAWVIFMFIMNTGTIIYHNTILANERDGLGWICVSVFQQALWMIAIFIFMGNPRDLTITCKTIVYVFGSVVVVLLNSVTLMTELILKTVNGERALGDLRVIVFLSEGIFTYSLLFLLMFGSRVSKMKCLQCCQNAAGSAETPANGLNQKQNTTVSHEMNPLLNQDQEADGCDILIK